MHNGGVVIGKITGSYKECWATVYIVKSRFANIGWNGSSHPSVLQPTEYEFSYFLFTNLVILRRPARLNVWPVYCDIVISVWATLLMLHSNSMEKLMNNNLKRKMVQKYIHKPSSILPWCKHIHFVGAQPLSYHLQSCKVWQHSILHRQGGSAHSQPLHSFPQTWKQQ